MGLLNHPGQNLQGWLFNGRAGKSRYTQGIRSQAQGVLNRKKLSARTIHGPQDGAGAIDT